MAVELDFSAETEFLCFSHSGKSESPIACSSNFGFTPGKLSANERPISRTHFFNRVITFK